MKKETLKELIEIEIERNNDINELKISLFKLIDLYELDNKDNKTPNWVQPNLWPPSIYPNGTTQTYSDICPCNPKNGGSGICGCTIGNELVEHPFIKTYWTTTSTGVNDEIKNNE